MTVMNQKNIFLIPKSSRDVCSITFPETNNNKCDCIVIGRYLMGEHSKDNNKNKEMITYARGPRIL